MFYLLTPFVPPGSHSPFRRRAPLLRKHQSRPHAPHKNARVRSPGRAVRTNPLVCFINRRDVFRANSSKQLSQAAPLASQSIPPAKVASLQSASQKDESSSHKETSSPSSPRSEGIREFYSSPSLTNVAKDSPLPPERGQNGTSAGGSARASAWAGPSSGWTNNNGPASTAAMGKPSLGRDPKSRARSRDYLKQYALGLKAISLSYVSQMLARDTISHIPSSVKSVAPQTACYESISSRHPSQCSIVRPDGL